MWAKGRIGKPQNPQASGGRHYNLELAGLPMHILVLFSSNNTPLF